MMTWIVWIRALAILQVVYLHILARPLQAWQSTEPSMWHVANIIDSLGRVCVPLFFMISGYLSLARYDNWKIFYKKRVMSIVLPFVFWWTIYFFLETNIDKYHYWFMWSIIPIFAMTPILNKVKDFKYVIFFILAGFAFKYTAYVSYFMLGYWLLKTQIFSSKSGLAYIQSNIKLVLYFLASAGTAWMTWKLAIRQGWFDEKYYSYYSPLVVFAGVSLFSWFENRDMKANWLVEKLAKHSFSIYLSHLLILERTYFLPIHFQFLVTIFASLGISIVADRLIVWTQQKVSP